MTTPGTGPAPAGDPAGPGDSPTRLPGGPTGAGGQHAGSGGGPTRGDGAPTGLDGPTRLGGGPTGTGDSLTRLGGGSAATGSGMPQGDGDQIHLEGRTAGEVLSGAVERGLLPGAVLLAGGAGRPDEVVVTGHAQVLGGPQRAMHRETLFDLA